ncbi:hypothetical protein GF314_01570, partial [bacterium]|nr:hypothetical protein [bacterium]
APRAAGRAPRGRGRRRAAGSVRPRASGGAAAGATLRAAHRAADRPWTRLHPSRHLGPDARAPALGAPGGPGRRAADRPAGCGCRRARAADRDPDPGAGGRRRCRVTILDWRSWSERHLLRRGGRTDGGQLARLAGRVLDHVASRRVARRGPPPAGTFVVSVGNLRVGGTGKTPVVGRVARDLGARGIEGVVITRGFRADDPTPRAVAPSDADAGDEARLLAGELAGSRWSVIQAPDRAGGLALVASVRPGAGVVLLEDAHQTAGVGRHADVVILDRWEVVNGGVRAQTGPVLPFGPYRETSAGARRAAVWLLETAEVPGPEGPDGIAILGFTRRARVEGPIAGPVGLVAGLARPERFEQTAARVLPGSPRVAVRLPDHARYDDRMLDRLGAVGRSHGVATWVTTAKDRVKLPDGGLPGATLVTLHQDVVWTTTPALPDWIEERRREWSRGRTG